MAKKKIDSFRDDRIVELLYSLSDALDLSEKIESSNARKREKMEFHIANALHIAKEFLILQELNLDRDEIIQGVADRAVRKSLDDTK